MKSPSRFPRLLPMLLVIALPTARAATVFTTDTRIGANDMTYEGHDLVVSNAVLTVDGSHAFNSLRVVAGGVLTHSASTNGTGAGLQISLVGDFELEAGASVNLDGRGYGGGQGPAPGRANGNPASGSGAGGLFGGDGGASSSGGLGGRAVAGMFLVASGGGNGVGGVGGAGGGLLYLHSTGGNFVINGFITTDGAHATNNRAGGGAGGLILLSAQTISGAGTLSARGGAGEPVHGGGGGGGHISVNFKTNTFIGSARCTGGSGWQHGGAGTFLLVSNLTSVAVTVDNGGSAGAATPLDWMTQESSATVEVRGHAVAVSRTSLNLQNLILRSNSTFTASAPTNNPPLSLVLYRDLTIEPGAGITLDGRGYPPNQGPGLGLSGLAGSGAGHGGYGGSGVSSSGTVAAGGNAYDSITSPTQLGSGGRTVGNFSGGAGGGAVRLMVNGTLRLDGQITTDGTAGSGTASGGASGGSVWLTLGGFSGNGLISANGGSGGMPSGGGGAGGRIAVTCNTSSFTGTITAFGGAGAMAGGAGTIYTKLYFSAFADLRVDNGGLVGTNTPSNLGDFHNLIIGGGAIYRPTLSTLTLGSVTVGPNSTWLLGNGSVGANVTVRNDVTVAAEGVVSGDGLGYAPGQGLGAANTAAAGGGHGGFGGHGLGTGSGTPSPGGRVYDSTANPVLSGSGGGSTQQAGGAGGAAVRLTAGALVLDGRLSANGNSNLTNNSGGGAGGALWLTLNQFSGSGSISADGGNGHLPNGGGGGGGRIAVHWSSNSFAGTYSAKGGNGFVPGGAGTIYLKANSASAPSLILDNGGRMGTNTVLDVSPLQNLTIASGARVVQGGNFGSGSLSVSNLQMASGATLYVTNIFLGLVTANIAAGAAILAEGVSTLQTGAGQTATLGSSGAGHAGYGGRGAGTASGGNAYELTATVGAGSLGGGSGSTPGLGGGVVFLNVSGPLVVDGRISANGSGARTNGSGGGSGGNLLLTLSRLSGSGIISADGGSGHLPNGGGGGGGRISITCASNLFSGTVSAKGGPGFAPGGAGLIQLRQSSHTLPIVIVDNGGVAGANTLLSGISSMRELNVRSGSSVTSSSPSLSVSNLTIEAKAALRVSSMQLTVGSANIAAGGAITADGFSSSGPGAGQTFSSGSGGGGHGGYGGRGVGGFGGNVYDLTANPAQTGSSGGGNNLSSGRGGGLLRMTVSGPLVLDGQITANGLSVSTNNAGGGSGGTVALILNQFSGSGLIAADGGRGHLPNGGGGGGGRISVSWNSNSFAGKYSAKGGNGFQAGGAGTIYLKRNNAQLPSLVVDNSGLSGTNTVLDVFSLSNLTVAGGAVLRPSSSSTLNLTSLNIASNGTLLASTLNISGPANVAAGGSISGDGLGSPGGTGFSGGAGGNDSQGSGGGGHAGYGGRGNTNTIASSGQGGNAYGSLSNPTQPGSGGGGFGSSGGTGGGTIRITATGPFTLDGRISANGLHSVSNNSGGGAGGSVILDLSRAPLLGTGAITADGGNGHLPNGGGGGGGRIAVTYLYATSGNQSSNGFFGTFSAQGGNGFMNGGAGTVYLRTSQGFAQVLVDNGGTRGTNTLVLATTGTVLYDLTVQGGAMATAIGNPRDLFVRSNGWLAIIPSLQMSFFPITRNATFDAGGGMDLSGLGNSSQGSGSTFTSPKGGGGHGGYGALNSRNGGNAYGSATAPTQSGSAGGNGSGSSGLSPFGGTGGGAARLTVGSTLLLNGDFSADGHNGAYNSGGGAGGSLWIEATTLTGDGQITARGGVGNGTAGGGGGGRIAIYYRTNLFTGMFSACGGDGALAGGAGTIYWRNTTSLLSSMVLDNCGFPGTNTPLSQTIGLATNLTVSGSAIAEMQGAIPAFSNLVVATGAFVTARVTDPNLYLALLGDLTVDSGAGIVMDAKGFARVSGPGAGASLANEGAGGSYGGWGGDSASGAFSGPDYGSATRPVDRGSGGGAGLGPPTLGSEGGGAVRLAVAGTLAVEGLISSGGGSGLQDDSGGGSGGSVWISAKRFAGNGIVAADGGDGEFYGGGGGGGGRVAIYSPMNTFTGLVSVAGGGGAFPGDAGTLFTSGSLTGFEVISQTPAGVVSNAVSQVTLEFSEMINPLSVEPDDVRLYTPYGLMAGADLSFSMPSPATLRINFPTQNVPGDYRLEVGPAIEGFLATRMSQVHTGAFTVMVPMISGSVTDTNGQPVAGVLLQPDGGLLPTLTDANGKYSLGVPSGWSGTVTPAMGEFVFVPGGRSYTNVTGNLTTEHYQMVASLAPSLQVGSTGTNLLLTWNAFAGATYQVFTSTNLVTWLPIDPPIAGTNGLMQLVLRIGDEPQKFFRVTAQN